MFSPVRAALAAGEIFRAHAFEFACAKADIDHRLTKPVHPWTKGQVERMNRTFKDATVRSYHYDSHQQLRDHLAAFVGSYNFAKRLKALAGLTPFEAICKAWTKEPQRFRTLEGAGLVAGPPSSNPQRRRGAGSVLTSMARLTAPTPTPASGPIKR